MDEPAGPPGGSGNGAPDSATEKPANMVLDRYGVVDTSLSEDARLVAKILDSLSKTSRAFRFYAPNNEALRTFVAELNQLFGQFFAKHSTLTLHIRATRFHWGEADEVVYSDDDRENSFPFKLYRDGIRILALKDGLTQDETMQLLGILGTRSVGTLQEEDLATLLWRAKMEHVEYRQVRGFVEASANHEDGGVGGGGTGEPAGAPDTATAMAVGEFGALDMNADQRSHLQQASAQLQGQWIDEWVPNPATTTEHTPPVFQEIDQVDQQLFFTSAAFDPASVLAQLLVRGIDTGKAQLPAMPRPEEFVRVLEDARAALLEDGAVSTYWQVLKALHDRISLLPPDDPWRTALEGLMVDGGGRTTVRLLLGALGRGASDANTVLSLVRTMRGLQMEWLMDALGEASTEQGRALVAEVLVHLVWPDMERCTQLAANCPDEAIRALVGVLARVGRLDALPILMDLFPRANEDTQADILQVAMLRPDPEILTRLANEAMNSSSDRVRILGLNAIARSNDPRLQRTILQMVEPAQLALLSREVAVEALRIQVLMKGQAQIEKLAQLASPPRLSLGDKKGDELRCRYVLALGAVATPKAEAALMGLRQRGSDTFQNAVLEALDRIARERYK